MATGGEMFADDEGSGHEGAWVLDQQTAQAIKAEHAEMVRRARKVEQRRS